MTEETHLKLVEPTYSIISFPAADLPEGYKALVYSKWLRSLRFGNPLFEKIESNEYYKNYHQFIENLLKKPDSLVRLAVLTEDEDVVLGFAVMRENVLDYVHVHRDQRMQGVAKRLVPDKITTISHLTTAATTIFSQNPKYKLRRKEDYPADRKVRYFVFNPFA